MILADGGGAAPRACGHGPRALREIARLVQRIAQHSLRRNPAPARKLAALFAQFNVLERARPIDRVAACGQVDQRALACKNRRRGAGDAGRSPGFLERRQVVAASLLIAFRTGPLRLLRHT